jgi:hydroxyacylglutathione hydrolase
VAIEIKLLTLSPIQQNTRILIAGDEALIIDPAGDAEVIINFLEHRGLTLTQIWLTHSHLDHCGGVADLMTRYPTTKLLGHPDEKLFRAHVEDICASYGIPPGSMKNCPEPTDYITGGERLIFGGLTFEALFTPGHAPGHIAFYQGDSGLLFAGDTLFAGSIGRTDLPGGDHNLLIRMIKEKILTLPDQTKVLSGHGPDTTVGAEKQGNPFL